MQQWLTFLEECLESLELIKRCGLGTKANHHVGKFAFHQGAYENKTLCLFVHPNSRP